jgi:hypothetical protein
MHISDRKVFSYSLLCVLQCSFSRGPIHFYCNNKGLLKKLQSLQSYNNAISSTVLHSEWDLVSSIHCLHHCFHPLPALQHVKGHQDYDVHMDLLDFPGQLNVETDTLATSKLQDYGSVKLTVPFDLESGIQLSIDGCAATCHLGTAIHNQQHLAPLHAYYCARFHHDVHCSDGIDWPIFAMVNRRFPCQCTFYSKIWAGKNYQLLEDFTNGLPATTIGAPPAPTMTTYFSASTSTGYRGALTSRL